MVPNHLFTYGPHELPTHHGIFKKITTNCSQRLNAGEGIKEKTRIPKGNDFISWTRLGRENLKGSWLFSLGIHHKLLSVGLLSCIEYRLFCTRYHLSAHLIYRDSNTKAANFIWCAGNQTKIPSFHWKSGQ